MQIHHLEIANFRKLLSVRVDLAAETTLLVGATKPKLLEIFSPHSSC